MEDNKYWLEGTTKLLSEEELKEKYRILGALSFNEQFVLKQRCTGTTTGIALSAIGQAMTRGTSLDVLNNEESMVAACIIEKLELKCLEIIKGVVTYDILRK